MSVFDSINKAVSLAKDGKNNLAEKIYLEILAKYPDDIRVLPFLGWLYISENRYIDAINVLEKVNRISKSINVITGLGLAYYGANRYKEAYHYLKIAANNNPTFDILYKLITSACEKTNQVETVFEYATKMNELYPDRPQTWDCYILAALCAGKFDEAENYCNDLLLKHQNEPLLYLSAGLIQEVVYSNYQLALECYLKAAEIRPSISAYYNIGLMYSRLKVYDKAELFLNKAIMLDSEAPVLNTAMFLLLAKQRKFSDAYSFFEKSAYASGFDVTLKNPWNGDKYINDTLYIYGDQGLGDIIMYARYLYLLKDKFKQVIVAVPHSLLTLFAQNFTDGFYKIVTFDDVIDYDYSTLISLLPYKLNIDYYNIPNPEGYLVCKEHPEDFFDLKFSNKLKVGVVWESGGVGLRGPLDRSINIKLLDKLFKNENIDFYSLQVNPAMNACEMYSNLVDLGSQFKDFLYTATAIKSMDLVISVDTSVAHLAGALGKKTFIMLPYSSDWRWFDSVKGTPWYSSVELFSQKTPGNWIDVIDDIALCLKSLGNIN